MINSDISKNIVHLSINTQCTGGISALMREYDKIFSPFYHITTTDSNSSFPYKILLWFLAFFKLTYFRFFKKVKIAHLHGCGGISLFRKNSLIRFARLLGMKTIFHLHGWGYSDKFAKINKKKFFNTFSHCDGVAVMSAMWQEKLETIIGYTKTFVVHNVIPSTDQKKIEGHFALRLLFLGYIDNSKGIFDLIETMLAHSKDWADSVHLDIGGIGPGTEELKNILKNNSENTMIKFHGWVTGEYKKELLQRCDVMILPSYHEGLPMVLLEAMSYGKAIISCPVGSIPEIIQDHVNGLLISPGDKKAMGHSIQELMDNPYLLSQFGEKSLNIIKSFYPESVERSLETIYTTILAQ